MSATAKDKPLEVGDTVRVEIVTEVLGVYEANQFAPEQIMAKLDGRVITMLPVTCVTKVDAK